ncbi:MAG: polysaccharide biosynthesis protein, partial [Oscillospiraceae bacterium]|nr:polysaccharide biosynthesis protein [Oscillospiraceae bacterium]
KPDVEIPIVYTGLRPGEKLYEEKLMAEEGLQKTPNELIHIGSPIPFDEDAFLAQLPGLMAAAHDGKDDQIRQMVAKVVPTYRPAGEHGSEHKGKAFEEQMKLVTSQ